MKCFLSHSSKDKSNYVRIVADKLRPNMTVFDEATFEEGMKTSSEILKGLDATDIFVLFISNAALNSDWVKGEIIEAYNRLSRGDIDRIYPIIIDPTVTHDDPRIPTWMRAEYNLRLVSRPGSAARRIQQRLRELSWKRHPRLYEKERIFVGRNEIIKAFEERIDDIAKLTPLSIICSGLKKIGRRAFLKHALTKTNVIDAAYEPLRVYLSQDDGLEGFIVKLYDLGVSSEHDLTSLLTKSIHDKTVLATRICQDISDAKDLIFIEDDGSIVNYEGQVANWFLDILTSLKRERVLFAVAAMYRPQRSLLWDNERLFSLNLSELEPSERKGLLKRYSDLEELDLPRSDLEFIGGLLQGYPEQIFFAIDTIRSSGIHSIRNNPAEITEFNKNRAAVVLRKYSDDSEVINLLRFLSEFQFVSYKLIEDILQDDPLIELLQRFVLESICEETGAIREYIRVNDIIRDYILRVQLEMPDRYARLLRERTAVFVKNNKSVEDGDASEYLFYIKSALADGLSIDERLLIPAHFLLTLREAYDNRRYNEVVKLCDRILQHASFLEDRIKNDVQYYLCQSLARLRNLRFLQEVQSIQGSEHDFLLGFYYRMQGRYKEAVERQLKAAKVPRSERRARRELVQNYLLMDDFDRAIYMAKDNYSRFPGNPFLVQGYFSCLIQQPKSDDHRKDLMNLIHVLQSIPGARAREMAGSARAFMASVYDGNESKALEIIEDTIAAFPKNDYAMLTKLDIAVRFYNKSEIRKCLDLLRRDAHSTSSFYNAYKKAEAVYEALNGNSRRALDIVDKEMPNYSDAARSWLLEKISSIHAR